MFTQPAQQAWQNDPIDHRAPRQKKRIALPAVVAAAIAGVLLTGAAANSIWGDAELEVSASGSGETEIDGFIGEPSEGDDGESAESDSATTTTTSLPPASETSVSELTTTTERPAEAEEPSATPETAGQGGSLEEESVAPSAPVETAAPTTSPPTTEQVTTIPPATEPPTTLPVTTAAASCHPAYSPCIPNHPGDARNCGELSSSQKPVTVLVPGVDPYNLDADDDGFGCESG